MGRDEFMSLYQPKINLFLNEMLNVFATPFILINLANSVEDLISFVTKYTEYVDGVGDICTFSRFDFEKFQSNVGKQISPSDLAPISPMESRQISNASNVSSATSSNTF